MRHANRNLEWLLLLALDFGFDFGDGVGANINFALRPGHPQEIGEQVEAGCDRHRFELGGHVRDVTSDVQRLVRRSSIRRIIGPSGPSPGAVSSGSPVFSTCSSRETHILNHTTTPFRSWSEADPVGRLAPGPLALFNARFALIRTRPLVCTLRNADFRLKNKMFLTILATPRFHNNVENSQKKC
jgi:hypothetical protein